MSGVATRCAAAIRRVGSETTLLRGEGEQFSLIASIQPRLSGGEDFGDPLGMGRADYYTLFSRWEDAPPRERDQVVQSGVRYRVLKVEVFRVRNESLYYWSLLRRETDGDALSGE